MTRTALDLVDDAMRVLDSIPVPDFFVVPNRIRAAIRELLSEPEGHRLDTEIASPRLGVVCKGQTEMTVMAAVATLNPRTCVAPHILDAIGAQMITMKTMITAGGAALFPIHRVVVRLGTDEREIEVVGHELMRHPMVLGTDLVRISSGEVDLR